MILFIKACLKIYILKKNLLYINLYYKPSFMFYFYLLSIKRCLTLLIALNAISK